MAERERGFEAEYRVAAGDWPWGWRGSFSGLADLTDVHRFVAVHQSGTWSNCRSDWIRSGVPHRGFHLYED